MTNPTTFATLTGNEMIRAFGPQPNGKPGGEDYLLTTQQIANLAVLTELPPIKNTAITTAGAGTLTGAGIAGGLITRSGPTAAFSDATDSAANIIAALYAYVANESAVLRVINTTQYAQTITAGSNITLTGITSVGPNTIGEFLVTVTGANAVAIYGLGTYAANASTIRVDAGAKVCTAQVDRATSTTLTNITGLSVTLASGGTYLFYGYVPGTATANGGAKFAAASDGTLSATSFSCTARNMNNATNNATTTTTTLGTAVGAATAVLTHAIIEGSIVVNVGGVMSLQIAQNASHADTTSAYVNGNLIVKRVS